MIHCGSSKGGSIKTGYGIIQEHSMLLSKIGLMKT